ncbi:MAG: chloramphenicol acetyltransferase [Candidatus Eremiobacteraeota bacterium]|nr:chloramphenicol acetyltransferase [Candidatus Eremiobacteraeota bacterium]
MEEWPRAGHFQFFSHYEEPFFSITAEVQCGGLLSRCEQSGDSKTFSLWHGILRACNAVEEFRYRVVDDAPVLYETVHLSPTVLRPDGTFAIAFVPFLEDYAEFEKQARAILSEIKTTQGFDLNPTTRRIDLIHFSTVPWIRFTGLTHARSTRNPGSEPKITIGKFGPHWSGGHTIPVSITGHHGLMDGYHVGRYLEFLEGIWS